MNTPSVYLTVIGTVIGFLLVPMPVSAQNADHGAGEYKLCASCHGFRGQGNHLVNAPAISSLEPWYLERQLINFRDGIRGHADDDQPGKTMAEMTRGLESDAEIADLVAYIETLPDAAPDATLEGDETNGRHVRYAMLTPTGDVLDEVLVTVVPGAWQRPVVARAYDSPLVVWEEDTAGDFGGDIWTRGPRLDNSVPRDDWEAIAW